MKHFDGSIDSKHRREARLSTGLKLRSLRLSAGFRTQKALAVDIGYSTRSIISWEQGADPPVWLPKYLDALTRLADGGHGRGI